MKGRFLWQKKNKKKEEIQEEPEILEETKELENDTKLNNEMLKLEKEINTLTEDNKNLLAQVQLAQAELVNYRKRKDEETANIMKYANQDLITELLPLVDNFERAIKQASNSGNPEISKYLTGFQMMYTNLLSILEKFGVEEINRPGEIFDANLEQAMVAENNPDLQDEVVIEVLQKGYKLKDRVIRPASVKINQL